MFRNIDKNWKEVLAETKKDPNIMKSCNREGLLARYLAMNEALDFV
jgi:hypothetical protein